jgi:hypothetical protein
MAQGRVLTFGDEQTAYRRVYHEENGDKLDAIRGELSYSPVEGITLPAIEIKELAWL